MVRQSPCGSSETLVIQSKRGAKHLVRESLQSKTSVAQASDSYHGDLKSFFWKVFFWKVCQRGRQLAHLSGQNPRAHIHQPHLLTIIFFSSSRVFIGKFPVIKKGRKVLRLVNLIPGNKTKLHYTTDKNEDLCRARIEVWNDQIVNEEGSKKQPCQMKLNPWLRFTNLYLHSFLFK